ncbi:MAG: response regulator [Nitrospirae bacterium]|nr:response regulator [Nitrospirota bacterium]
MSLKDNWNLLVVDDEPDIHDVTRIALKRKKWREKSMNIVPSFSAKEAKQMLGQHDREYFDVCLIDVVMESDTAGLELCKYIRDNFPISLRLILRTGQAGKAPEEQVMNEYDIDHYLSKTEATPDRIFGLVRSCLRVSEEIYTVLALSSQLQKFSGKILSDLDKFDSFIEPVDQTMHSLEIKYKLKSASALIGVFSKEDNKLEKVVTNSRKGVDEALLIKTFEQAINERVQPYKLYREISNIALNDNEYLVMVPLVDEVNSETSIEVKKDTKKKLNTQKKYLSWIRQVFSTPEEVKDKYTLACIFIRSSDKLDQIILEKILSDLRIYGESWKMTYLAYHSQKKSKRQEYLDELLLIPD